MLVLSLQLSFLWLNWFSPGSLRYHMTYLAFQRGPRLGNAPNTHSSHEAGSEAWFLTQYAGTKNVQPFHTILPLSPLVIGSRDPKNLRGVLNSNPAALQQLGHTWRLERVHSFAFFSHCL